MKDTETVDFWRSFFITYILTCVTVIATVFIQYNIGVDNDLFFYRVSCSNYWILSFAKVIDALVPTTITFALTLFISNYQKNGQDIIKTLMIILLITLVIAGITFSTVKNIISLWVLVFLLIFLISGVLICCKLLICKNDNKKRSKKREKFDGRAF